MDLQNIDAERVATTRLTEAVKVFDRFTLRSVVAILAFNTLVVVILLCRVIPHHARVVIDNLSQCLGPFLACVFTLGSAIASKMRARRSGGKSYTVVPAVCLALGALAFAIGQSIWSYYELVLNVATPFPSWADAFYLSAYPFLFVGILTLPTNPISVHRRTVVFFESLMFMAGVVTFSWYFVLGPTVLQTGESMLARVLGTAYPLCDLGLICCLLLLFVRSGGGQIKSTAVTLAAGLASIVWIDTVFDYQTLHNTYETGHVIDVGWTLGYMLMAAAGESALRIPKKLEQTSTLQRPSVRTFKLRSLKKLAEIRPVIVQYSVVVLVAGLLWETSRSHGDHRLNVGVHIGTAVIVALLLMRQFFMLLENQELNRKAAAFNENLEAEVRQRTQELAIKTDQLTALQLLTSAVNETLDIEKVLSVAVVHLQAAFGSVATGLWLFDSLGNAVDVCPKKCVGLPETSEAFALAAAIPLQAKPTVGKVTVPATESEGEVVYEYLQTALQCRGTVIGKIGVLRASGDLRATEVGMLESIGQHIAAAVENAKQYWNARDAADRDPITALLNHRAIHEYLDTSIELQSDFEEPLAVILADVDNFHMFNDTYGHPVGDDVLCKVGAILDSCVTAPGKVGRYRGDEFILVLPGYTSEQSIAYARDLQSKISNLKLQYGGDDRTIPISLSFGIACFPDDSKDRQDLLVTADSNLNSAKNSDAHIVALSEMQRAHRELRVSSSFRMLDGMVTAVDNKDKYTRRHSEDVTEFALQIADELGLDDETKQILRTGGLLHDVGKICVPDEILRKPSRLTEEEYNVLKQHPTLGALIVGGVSGMENILDAVKYHHEQWDGKGYPEALAGTDIPFIARLLAVADAMSAMTTDRPYRKGMPMATALEQIRKNIGTQFDPEMANAFLRIAERKCPQILNVEDSEDLPKAA